MKKFVLLVLGALALSATFAIEIKYPVSEIADSLKLNADAVVRYHSIEKSISSDSKVTTKENLVITIFNKNAEYLGYFLEFYNNLSHVNAYSVRLYNQLGVLTSKSKSSDFIDVKAYDGFSLYDDNRLIYLRSIASTYPYTVEITCTRVDKQTLGIRDWNPVRELNVSVQKSIFKLSTTPDFPIKFYEKNLSDTVSISELNGTKTYQWELNNYKALNEEVLMPNSFDLLPLVKLESIKFNYQGHTGMMTDWKSFGQWNWDLIAERDELNPEDIYQIQQLVKNVTDDKEKIKVLYQYLQDNTRYVSIQLGIGGNQPFEATMVHETKYGDCKALSNYMKAMLKAIDIKSDYAIINAGKDADPIITDFPSHQFNHVILCVPNHGDTIWLECTSQRAPFGFLGSFTENRYALLIKENGSEIVKTPAYNKEVNVQENYTHCLIDSLGNSRIDNKSVFKAMQYEHIERYFYLTPNEQLDELYKAIQLPNLKIETYQFTRDNSPIPSAQAHLKLTVNKLCVQNGNRMFIPVNPLNKSKMLLPKKSDRVFDVVTKDCGMEIDSVIFELPNNYTVEFIPKQVSIQTQFGTYQSRIIIDNQKIIFVRNFSYEKGTFPASDYDQLKEFYTNIAAADNQKVILIR